MSGALLRAPRAPVPPAPPREDELILLRVAGLPASTLDGFRADELPAAVAALDDAGAAWAAEAERVRDALYAEVPRLADGARAAALAVRRSLSGPAAFLAAPVEAVRPAVPATLGEALAVLRAGARRVTEAEAALEGALARAAERGRSTLREALADPWMLQGLALSSPALARRVPGYAASGGRALRGRDLKAEESLLSYVVRAAAKTSPFSTFTFTAAGRPIPGAPAGARLSRTEVAARLELNRVLAERLLARYGAAPAVREAMWLHPTARLDRDEGSISFIAHRPDAAGAGEGCVPVEEREARLPATPALDEVIRRLEGGPMELGTLVDGLAATARAPREGVAAFVGRLVETGLLIARPPLDETARGFGRELLRWLAARLGTTEPEAAAALEALDRAVEACEAAQAGGRPSALAGVDAALRGAEAAAGMPPFSSLCVLEDAVAPGVLALPPGVLSGFEAELDAFGRLSCCFDTLHLRRARLADFMREAGGDGVPVLDLYRRYRREGVRSVGEPGERAESAAVEEIRAFQAGLRAAVREAVVERGEDRVVLPERLEEALAARPASVEPGRSAGFFLQAGSAGDAPVVNLVVPGTGKYFSRFVELLEGGAAGDGEVRARLRRRVERLAAPGEAVADLGVVAGATVNVHPLFAPYRLAYPGVSVADGGEAPIPLEELTASLDEAGCPQLVWRRNGMRVRPVHFGFLITQWMPELSQFLLHFTLPAPRALPWHETILPDSLGRTHTPRMYFGGTLLYRRAWHFAPEELPREACAAGDRASFAALTRWRRAAGVPEVGFVRVDQFTSAVEGVETRARADQRSFRRKPQYLDFTSPLSLPRIRRLFSLTERKLTITEVYPSPAGSGFLLDGRPHVCEMLVERELC